MLNKLMRTFSILIASLLLTACQEKTYDYGFSEGGIGGKGWPTWGEYLIVNEAWQVPVGNLSGERVDNIPDGSQSALGDKPLPKTLRARWFSYRTQTFYEASLTIPEDKQRQIKDWFYRYPRPEFLHTLSVGLAGQGEIQAWWTVVCIKTICPDNLPERDYFELVPRTKAVKGEGDPNQYYNTTREHIRDGTIPSDVLNLIPEMKNPPKENPYEDILHFVPKQ